MNMLKLTRHKAKAFSTLCTNFAAVFLASLVIPTFINGVDVGKIPVISLGLVATVSASWLSLLFAEKGKL